MKGNGSLFIRRCMEPLPVAYYHAMAIEELSFRGGFDIITLTCLQYHQACLDMFDVAERRAARHWAARHIDPKPVARHKLATQKARLQQIRDRR